MNVLSLFDGISCGQVALEKANIKVTNYFASELDKYAIQVTQKNYSNTIQLGDVTKVRGRRLPKIDLLIGGSPCQGFSFAGKQLNFNDPRSALFFEYVRLLKEVKPKYFLLENVKMKKEYQDVISSYLGVEPVEINSALVSAQNRKRLYWTNIPNIKQPKDKGIVLKDIIEYNYNKSFYYNESTTKDGKAYALTARYSGAVAWNSCERKQRTMIPIGESEEISPNIYNGLVYRKLTPLECERLQTLPDNYTDGVSDTQRYKALGNGFTVDVIKYILRRIKYDRGVK